MSDWRETKETQEQDEQDIPHKSAGEKLSPRGTRAMRGNVDVQGHEASEDPKQPDNDDDSGTTHPREHPETPIEPEKSKPKPEDREKSKPNNDDDDDDLGTIHPRKHPETPTEPERQPTTIIIEDREKSKPKPPESWRPGDGPERGG